MQVSYDLAVFNDQNRANSFNWGFAVSSSNLSDPSGLSYTQLAAFTSPETADPDPVSWTKQTLFVDQPVNVPNGHFVYFQWFGDDVSGAGNWDQFAIAQFSITPVPEPSLMLLAGVPILAAWRLRRNRGKTASVDLP